ncbi:hypothetical protein [Brachyspira intermedia]|uniref:hypothetical protein n=1 Tax=Brachyspira intermedia TaxID=84377 RepID=UPI0030074977
MSKESITKSKSKEIGGLMQQDKKIEHNTNDTKNKSSDYYVRENSSGESYKEYNEKLKKGIK